MERFHGVPNEDGIVNFIEDTVNSKGKEINIYFFIESSSSNLFQDANTEF